MSFIVCVLSFVVLMTLYYRVRRFSPTRLIYILKSSVLSNIYVLPDIRSDIYFEIVGPTAFLSVRTDGPTIFGKSGLIFLHSGENEIIMVKVNFGNFQACIKVKF